MKYKQKVTHVSCLNIAGVLILLLILIPCVLGQNSRPNSIKSAAPNASLFLSAFQTDEVVIRDGWIQEGPPSQTITAGYMVIENHTHNDLSLQSASTDVAQVVELHKMELIDGIMKMQKVKTIDIPAAGETELKPGGYHLMVIGLKKELKDGDKVTFTLRFSHDVSKTITIPVRPRSAMVKQG